MRRFLASLAAPVAIITLLFAATASIQSAHAATLFVTNTADSGAGSLRDTIAAASDGDTIQFDAALNGQAITLTSGELLIDKNLTINGPGANLLAVQRSTASGTPAFRIFRAAMPSTEPGSITIAGLTISNGNDPELGGGIVSIARTLTISRCVISGNSAPNGGGLYCGGMHGTLLAVNVIDSTISGNSSTTGGGIYVTGPYFYGFGGAALAITNSTISGNTATGDGSGRSGGGGIFSQGRFVITNSTISGNSASLGGGINDGFNFPIRGPSVITNSTISGNSASEGGGIYTVNFGEQRSRNAIIALNTSADGPDVKGPLTSEGFNLVGDNSGATISSAQTSDQIGTPASPIDPRLGPLRNNGGPTFTHVLLQGSPAIDQGESSGTTTDQRGARRPVDFPAIANEPGGDGADIGAFESAPATLANISTRLRVGTGDNVMIGGFIITGTEPKTVVVRGLGPSLPLSGALADPVIEVHGPSGEVLGTNDNWNDALTRQQITDSGLAPVNDLESALWGTINPGAYTVVVRGTNNTTGIALFEVYDLDQTADSKLGNISTRGFVDTGDNVMIGGVILVGSAPARVLFRAIGPSLTNVGVPNALGDPILELYDANGGVIVVNYNWRDDQEAEILATGIPPPNDLESAIVRDFAPGNYTAIVRGLNNTTGTALVEAYDLN
ncbi:MAG TPA: choice-of-anchor Q domain-containing protein [Chthoniobacterales bacterium]|nr:choice-of-anchor Q domain-containing protein [Chthoniobacterales bacterium]